MPHFVFKVNPIAGITLTDNEGVIFMQTASVIRRARRKKL